MEDIETLEFVIKFYRITYISTWFMFSEDIQLLKPRQYYIDIINRICPNKSRNWWS